MKKVSPSINHCMGLWDKESKRHQEKNTETTQRHCKERFQAIHQPAPCK